MRRWPAPTLVGAAETRLRLQPPRARDRTDAASRHHGYACLDPTTLSQQRRVPRWVSKLHRLWPGGGPPARADSSLSKGCRDYDRDRSGAKQCGFTAAASSPATGDSRIAPSFQEIRHGNSPVRNRSDPRSESDKQHPALGAAQELQNKTETEMVGEDSCG